MRTFGKLTISAKCHNPEHASFDDFVGECEEGRGNLDVYRPCCLQVDGEGEPGGFLTWEIRKLRALQNESKYSELSSQRM
jgi:hypothetical protein